LPFLNYRNFSDAEHQKSILDLEAAADFLIQERKAVADKCINNSQHSMLTVIHGLLLFSGNFQHRLKGG